MNQESLRFKTFVPKDMLYMWVCMYIQMYVYILRQTFLPGNLKISCTSKNGMIQLTILNFSITVL